MEIDFSKKEEAIAKLLIKEGIQKIAAEMLDPYRDDDYARILGIEDEVELVKEQFGGYSNRELAIVFIEACEQECFFYEMATQTQGGIQRAFKAWHRIKMYGSAFLLEERSQVFA